MLLHWCTIHPEGPSNLAAIRFASPIRVQSIRVFPTGAQPFIENPDIVAQTDPEAFFLDVFFNAHPIHPIPPSESKEKHRAPNALVPSVIAYAGGQMDFTVDMGTEYATRLMIVKGKFEALSMAIYGNIVSDMPPLLQTYEPRPIPAIEPLPLSRAVDPSNASDPTLLAKQLLSLIPDSPPLPVVIRLMFCLKPSEEDWDLPEFPYLNPDLDAEVVDYDFEKALHCTAKPVRDDIPYEFLAEFASKVADSIGAKNSNQSYQIARLLCNAASQHPDLSRVLLQQLDLASIFDAQNLDELAVLRLLYAATNVDIARHLNNESFLRILRTIQDSASVDKHTQVAVRRLSARIRGWHSFEDALSNTQGDFSESIRMLKDIGTEELSLGAWLESMIIHDDIVTKLAENPVLPVPQSPSPFLLRNSFISVSHGDFINFLRAYIGVSSVLAVWGWTDSVGNEICRERTLSVLRLWQGVDGYREIVNHLLLLRQFTSRLRWITTDNDTPRKSGVLGEQILVDLAKEPHSILQDGLVETILSLTPPLSFISENERLSMRKVALVADDGLPAAIEELTFSSAHPLSLRRLRTLRVSLAIVKQQLQDDKGEWRVLQALWDEQSHGFVSRLVDIFLGIADDLNGHFVLTPPRMNQALVDELFRTADDLLRQIACLTVAYPLTGRSMRSLIAAVADVFACTDAADMLYSQSSSACISAQGTRQTCLDIVRSLSGPQSYAEPGKLGAEIALRTLLEHGVQSGGRDPAYHLLQVFTMIDHILPQPNFDFEDSQQSHWVTMVLPNVLPETKSFFRVLDAENKVHLIKRLVKLDDGIIGIGEWLFEEELKHLYQTLQVLTDDIPDMDYRSVRQHQVTLSLRFILDLVTPSSSASEWCIKSIASIPDIAHNLTDCLLSLLNHRFTSSFLAPIAQVLAPHSATFDPNLRFATLVALLRIAQSDGISSFAFLPALEILRVLPSTSITPDLLQLEIGRTLSSFAATETTLTSESSEALLAVLEWLLDQDNPSLTTLCGITASHFSQLCDRMCQTLSPSKADIFEIIRSKINVEENESFCPATVPLPESLELSIQNIEDLLHPEVPVPSTPKGDNTPDILGLVTLSPPMALLRSPAATGLTKTYVNNDFRQLRQVASTRQNTSRLPSMHVDVGIHGRLT